jgi:hypothetical protein
MLRRILALATLLAAGLLGAHVPGANVASEQIAGVKKVYVEKFGGGEGADQIRDMVIATIQRTNLFVLTENPERADTLLRGSAEDLIYTENFQSNEGVTARPYGSASSGSTRATSRLTAGVSIGDHDSVHQQERKHEASASVRLVNREGDVIWSTIQESQGAKFRSAAADVAERIGRQLAADYAKVLSRRVVATAEGVHEE